MIGIWRGQPFPRAIEDVFLRVNSISRCPDKICTHVRSKLRIRNHSWVEGHSRIKFVTIYWTLHRKGKHGMNGGPSNSAGTRNGAMLVHMQFSSEYFATSMRSWVCCTGFMLQACSMSTAYYLQNRNSNLVKTTHNSPLSLPPGKDSGELWIVFFNALCTWLCIALKYM